MFLYCQVVLLVLVKQSHEGTVTVDIWQSRPTFYKMIDYINQPSQ